MPLTILFGILAALPNLFTAEQLARLPNVLPKQQVTLGLDLRGGSHLVLEVDAASLIRERLQILASKAAVSCAKPRSASPPRLQRDSGSVTVALGE